MNAALSQRLADLAAILAELRGRLDGPPLLVARTLVAVDEAASTLTRHAEGLRTAAERHENRKAVR